MTDAPEDIISDEAVTSVHGHANFGGMTPREVLADGVLKYAMGYTGGYTQLTILLEHKLIKKPEPGQYYTTLTKLGQKYLRATHPITTLHATSEALASSPDVQALIAEARREEREQLLLLETLRKSIVAGPMPGEDMRHWIERQRVSASAIRAMKEETQ